MHADLRHGALQTFKTYPCPVVKAVSAYTSWWFHMFFIFTPDLGKIPILTNIFQRGWNHQPVYNLPPTIVFKLELQQLLQNTLLEIIISHTKTLLKMIFLFSRWDMLVPWRVIP